MYFYHVVVIHIFLFIIFFFYFLLLCVSSLISRALHTHIIPMCMLKLVKTLSISCVRTRQKYVCLRWNWIFWFPTRFLLFSASKEEEEKNSILSMINIFLFIRLFWAYRECEKERKKLRIVCVPLFLYFQSPHFFLGFDVRI